MVSILNCELNRVNIYLTFLIFVERGSGIWNHSAECTCEESLCETLRAFSAQHPESVLYQTSLMSALLSGVYEGSTTIADLLKHGDFGLGTFNELDGELIAFSSQVYQLRADGSARKAQPEQKTPFAVMTWFPAAVPENL
ncbi:alpha-acetolactate decarboxylase [Klebsiella pneumoniae]|uniref:Alpha-acetolactate decarboxylase n=1 Tax=Klebsiella pneumoniae TaxID=573 RepID=A0A377X968_KLEPN|nr:alpha-acetolactate decarboxylase [Klebsiella pneumoniae]